jgi:DNA-damage-inducible protein D
MTDSERDVTPTTDTISPFDAIKHHDKRGDHWSARELSVLLGYKPNAWHNFESVIAQAMEACRGSGQDVDAHFERVETQSPTASRRYTVKDVHLSRYGAYLVVQNADPSKEVVALGQTYFAVRTRQDELTSEREEMRQRIVEREKLARYRRALYKTARAHGVITPLDFAVFENHGNQGLYHETAEEILQRKELRPTDNPADYMGVLETAANGFRVALANELLTTQPSVGKDRANSTHERAGAAVRKTMEEMGVPTPERLPTPAQSIQQVRLDLARQKRIEEEDRLGLWALMDDETQAGGDDA